MTILEAAQAEQLGDLPDAAAALSRPRLPKP